MNQLYPKFKNKNAKKIYKRKNGELNIKFLYKKS